MTHDPTRPPRTVTLTRPAIALGLAVLVANLVGCSSFSGPETKYLPAPIPSAAVAPAADTSTTTGTAATSTPTRARGTRLATTYARSGS